ncbi:hypothetical protein PEC301653_32700 [Pectobacterium carotovorum subsp. carotovorum]|nr:hypothetical protein PEC301653_32700 [Pectobacterium carotovorum subsp. carotovorum]
MLPMKTLLTSCCGNQIGLGQLKLRKKTSLLQRSSSHPSGMLGFHTLLCANKLVKDCWLLPIYLICINELHIQSSASSNAKTTDSINISLFFP